MPWQLLPVSCKDSRNEEGTDTAWRDEYVRNCTHTAIKPPAKAQRLLIDVLESADTAGLAIGTTGQPRQLRGG